MLHLTDTTGAPLPRRDGAFILPERATLRVAVAEGWSVDLEGRPILLDPTDHAGEIALPFAVGRLTLRARRGRELRVAHLRVQPAEHKLGGTLWATLLDEVEAWLPGATAGVEAARHGGLKLDALPLPAAVEATLPLLPDLHRALALVLAAPRAVERTPLEDQPIDRARTLPSGTVSWLASHPGAVAWLRPNPPRSGRPPPIPLPTPVATLDHPANRHLLWLVARVAARLRGAAAALRGASCSDLNDTRAWRDGRVQALDRAADALDRAVRASPLRNLRPAPASGEALLVVQGAPAYARVQQLARRLLRLGASAEPLGQIATRPSFHLYELWCLLAVGRAVQAWAGPAATSRWRGLDKLRSLDGSGAGAELLVTNGSTRLTLLFNPTFPSLLNSQDPQGRHALTGERRPDLVLRIDSPDGGAFVVLDAKYTGDRQGLADAFPSAHVYAHALRWPDLGGPPRRSVLLVPAQPEGCAPWFSPAFLREHGISAIMLRPGGDPAAALAEVLGALTA